ncbi:MAG: alpha/beta hydrolase [Candidatus Thorarchaeota archaeon]|jgi:dienelactone hydrolase
MQVWKSLDKKKQLFILCFILIGSSALFANLIQNDFGQIDVKTISIVDENGLTVVGKLYRPLTATSDDPAPGVLLLHGMNNDKDTEAPAALELTRRGFVALALDQLSHGDSTGGGNLLGFLATDSDYTLGANASYQYLKNLAFVDGSSTGLVGHSMGAGVARTLARTNSDHRAVVVQAGGPDNLTLHNYMNNYLNVWAHYEELSTAQDRSTFVDQSLNLIGQNAGLAPGTPGEADNTYGTFADGSAHRYALCESTHPGATWNNKGVAETCAWMLQALGGSSESEAWNVSGISTQTYQIREGAMLFTLIVAVLSIIPLAAIIIDIPYFNAIARTMPTRVVLNRSSWWKFATINAAIGGITFLFIPMIGLFVGAMVGSVIPIFLLVTGNGSLLWLLVNALIAWIVYRRWFRKVSTDEGVTHSDIGRFDSFRNPEAREILIRTIFMSAILFGYLYILVSFSQSYLEIEFRYMWPVLKIFTPVRFVQFLLYIFPVLPFFLVNGGVLLFGMLRQEEGSTPLKTQIVWWLKAVFAMESVLLIAVLGQYLPMFLFGTGPLLSFGIFFGLYGIFAMQILPLLGGIFFVMTAFYRMTGRIYLGTIVGTLLLVWIMSVGSMMI